MVSPRGFHGLDVWVVFSFVTHGLRLGALDTLSPPSHLTYTSMSTYKGTVCLSKRTYRYLHEARMNVISVAQYHIILRVAVGRAVRLHARKQSVAWPRYSNIADYYLLVQSVVRFRFLLHY